MRKRLWALVLAAAILGAAAASLVWREWLTLPNNHLSLAEQLDEQERQAAERERARREKPPLDRQAERLREDLARENMAGRRP